MAPRVMLVTVPGGGHFNTGMLFARKLATKGCTVTVVVPFTTPSIRINTSNIEFVALSELNIFKGFSSVVQGIREPLLVLPKATASLNFGEKLGKVLDSVHPEAVVLDRTVVFWADQVVEERNIPKFILYTGASAHLAAMLSFHGPNSCNDIDNIPENGIPIPGLPPVRSVELPKDVVVKSHQMYLGKEGVAKYFVNSAGMLLNTSKELEGHILDAFEREYPEIRFIPIGPLYPPSYLSGARLSEDDLKQNAMSGGDKTDLHDLVSWLDVQPRSSVVFCCFGSWLRLSDELIRALASGLELSGYRFVWSIPKPVTEESSDEAYLERVLPPQFLERTSSVGKVVGWAPQQVILSHPSVGAFVTHCGWSSIVECIILAGVPILGFPFLGDQPLACKNVVEQLKIGVDIGVDGVPSSDDVKNALESVMEDEDLRKRAKERSNMVREAALSKSPGSSAHTLSTFVSSLSEKL